MKISIEDIWLKTDVFKQLFGFYMQRRVWAFFSRTFGGVCMPQHDMVVGQVIIVG
jgi:hypothetical protein